MPQVGHTWAAWAAVMPEVGPTPLPTCAGYRTHYMGPTENRLTKQVRPFGGASARARRGLGPNGGRMDLRRAKSPLRALHPPRRAWSPQNHRRAVHT